ncbi:unnamed protein product [Bursaphelenchus okinawaensis]|uniref:Uncharacterized protein n=1 Tax=Bursaphelenchus okinawaensis TaxID=465554 RepID=A0A811L6J8_9BILA|nr:unnamed protein product [Bursaphelenchus okinawaensis]CAG9118978.1 unnamed protein product [Bursaphelenchus okinawaensis]
MSLWSFLVPSTLWSLLVCELPRAFCTIKDDTCEEVTLCQYIVMMAIALFAFMLLVMVKLSIWLIDEIYSMSDDQYYDKCIREEMNELMKMERGHIGDDDEVQFSHNLVFKSAFNDLKRHFIKDL